MRACTAKESQSVLTCSDGKAWSSSGVYHEHAHALEEPACPVEGGGEGRGSIGSGCLRLLGPGTVEERKVRMGS